MTEAMQRIFNDARTAIDRAAVDPSVSGDDYKGLLEELSTEIEGRLEALESDGNTGD